MNLLELSRNTLKDCLHFVGLDVVRYNVYHSEAVLLSTILRHFDVNIVIDVGANDGEYASKIMKHGYRGQICSFEPLSSVYKVLERRTSESPQWTAFNLGIGSKEGEAMINISENLFSSSLFKVSAESLDAEPRTRIMGQEKVKMTTVDSFFSKEYSLHGNVMLKLDVQGSELEALKGATRTLPGLKLIQAELSFVPVYEGIPLFGEVLSFLEAYGYEIFTIIPGFRNADTGRMLEADGIFVRKN